MQQILDVIRQLMERFSIIEKRINRLEVIEKGGGAVDSVNGQTGVVNLDADDIDETATRIWFTSAEESKLAGIETGADVTDAGNVGSAIHGATGKTTPVDADTVPLIDSAAGNVLKKVTWANLKATLKTYLDTLYNLYTHPNHTGDVTSTGDGATTIANNAVVTTKINDGAVTTAKINDGAVTNAKLTDMAQNTIKGRVTAGTGDPEDLTATQVRTVINVEDGADVTDAGNVGSTIHGATEKTTPADGDTLPLIDSAASNVLKKLTWANLKATLKTYLDTLYVALTGNQTVAGVKTFTNDVIASTIRLANNTTGLSLVGGTAHTDAPYMNFTSMDAGGSQDGQIEFVSTTKSGAVGGVKFFNYNGSNWSKLVEITASGNMVVGSTNQGGRFNVDGGTIEFDPGSGADTTRALNFNIASNNYGKILIPSGSGGAMAFWTGSAGAAAERMRIHPTGEVEMPYGIRSGNVTISNNGYTLLAAADVPKRGFILIQAGVNSDEWAIIAYRIDTTPYCVLGVGGGATNVATVALNGSTGSANFATVSATTSGIYIENRHGGSRDIRYLLIGD